MLHPFADVDIISQAGWARKSVMGFRNLFIAFALTRCRLQGVSMRTTVPTRFDSYIPLRYNRLKIDQETVRVYHYNPGLHRMLNLSRMASGPTLPCRGAPV